MPESKNHFSGIIIFVVGVIGLVILARNIISSKEFPSLGEFMASSTGEISSTTDSLLINQSVTQENVNKSYATATIYASKGMIIAEIANTPAKRELGLSNRTSLATNTGILFIFPNSGEYDFWMKDMNFPLDIVWIRPNKVVAGVDAGILPETFPETFNSPTEIQFVLELNANDAKKFGIATGTVLKF
jgi:hypothetical protein